MNLLSMAPSSSSKSKQCVSSEKETRNWLELPRDVMSEIFLKLGAIDIITSVQLVCSLWHKICKDPLLWRRIDMHNLGDLNAMDYDLEIMCRHAVDRSCGQLVDISIEYFGTHDLLKYITDSTCHLRHLRLACCYGISDAGFVEDAAKLPATLVEFELTICQNVSKDSLIVIGRSCPLLKSFKFNGIFYRCDYIDDDDEDIDNDGEAFDGEAFAIAETMPGLCHLQLIGNMLTNNGLVAILDGCRHLESLNLRRCLNLFLPGRLFKRCTEQIKYLRVPFDSTKDYPFQVEYDNGKSSDVGSDNDSTYDYDYGPGSEADALDSAQPKATQPSQQADPRLLEVLSQVAAALSQRVQELEIYKTSQVGALSQQVQEIEIYETDVHTCLTQLSSAAILELVAILAQVLLAQAAPTAAAPSPGPADDDGPGSEADALDSAQPQATQPSQQADPRLLEVLSQVAAALSQRVQELEIYKTSQVGALSQQVQELEIYETDVHTCLTQLSSASTLELAAILAQVLLAQAAPTAAAPSPGPADDDDVKDLAAGDAV